MPRQDSPQAPPRFFEIANARAMGPPVQVLQGGSRLQAARNKLLTIVLFEGGSVLGLPDDPKPFGFRYDEVDRFTQHAVRKYVNGSYRGTDITCWVGLNDGRTHRIGGQTTRSERHIIEDFIQYIDPRITTAQLPRMQSALRQRQPVAFGDYTMDLDGLRLAYGFGKKKEKRLTWPDTQEVTIKAGAVQVKARGKRFTWATVNVESVPNLTAFMTLVRAATSG
jgi:hypothetical protein